MNKTFLKILSVVLILTGFVIVLISGSPTAEKVFASRVAIAHHSTDSKDLPKKVVLSKDSADDKYGEVDFDHDTHSFKKYSPDGTKDIGCAECHHTDQPKSALKGVLVTSERDVVLTEEVLKKPGTPVVKSCRTCHFQDGSVPEDKEMPTAKYNGKTKELNNLLAYHLNCNTCHDEAARLRPALRSKPGFATGAKTDCLKCHKPK